MSDTILAIDLGRYNSVACVYSRATRDHTFRTLDTAPADLARLIAGYVRDHRPPAWSPPPPDGREDSGDNGRHGVHGFELLL